MFLGFARAQSLLSTFSLHDNFGDIFFGYLYTDTSKAEGGLY